jgi:hypothetical protein
MSTEVDKHLNEDQQLMAVVDERDLSGEKLHHLKECSACMAKVEQFRAGLSAFGDTAMSAVEPMTRTIELPEAEPAPVSPRLSWLPSFGAAVMAGLVLFVYFLAIEMTAPGSPAFQSPEELLAEEYLMDDIFQMVENPLPDELYDITGMNGGFDDEFLEFVVPVVDDDYQSQNIIWGGVKQC